MPYSYSVFGADARQVYLASLLEQAGYSTIHTIDTVRIKDVVILPIPSTTASGEIRGTQLSFTRLLCSAPAGTVFWGSGFAPYQSLAGELGLRLCEATAFPQFAEENAIPTAEGALQIAMKELPTTIHGGHFLVIGYGRIGRQLTERLAALGGTVTVARRETGALPFRQDQTSHYRFPLSEYDAIFNTAPYPVFSREDCLATREDCLLIDLASAPGGIAPDCSRRLIHALGLPAKVAPKTAATALLSIILKEMEG